MFEWITIIALSLAPISELRGAIPAGIAFGLNPWLVFMVAVCFNIFAFLPIYIGLNFFYKYIKNKNFVKKIITRARERGHKSMEKYGIWGLILFVAIPLPMTGVWTATLISWIFDIERWKSFILISIGVVISGLIVTLASLGVINLIW